MDGKRRLGAGLSAGVLIRTRLGARAGVLLGLLCLLLLGGGCIGSMDDDGRPSVPRYRNLQDQSIAIMVWTEKGIQYDFPPVQLDLATAVQRKLSDGRSRELSGATFPVNPRSIVRLQQDRPELQRRPITEIAQTFGVTRLIYIEIDHFSTRSETAMELYRGSASAAVKVVEVDPDGTGRIAYEERDIEAIFPPRAPPDGIADATDVIIYRGLVDQMSDEIISRFMQMRAHR